MFFSVATILVAALSVSAQSPTTHTVMVGQNGTLTYNPSNITAAMGDIVSFVFTSKNHTVTQSTFAAPCTQLTNASVTPNVVGISSGFVPVQANASDLPTWSFALTDTNPLWFFCLQGSHCQAGMVFSINATPQKTYDMFLTAAKATNGSVANPQTLGAATTPNGTVSNGPDTGSPSSSTTSAPNGTPAVSQSGTAAPSSSSPGAALANVKAPSIVLGALAVMLGVAL